MNTDPSGMIILVFLMLSLLMMQLHAQEWPELYKRADLKLGESLILENKCSQCRTKLNPGFFPEEVTSIAAVLNRDCYRFR